MASNQSAQTGYELNVYGIDNGQFLVIHIPALALIFLSLLSAVTVIIVSCTREQNSSTTRISNNSRAKRFFSWSKSERFVVYLAICDGLFNICHSMDHLHIVIARDHVYPRQLCSFYGFMLAVFITAQNLLVNVVSVNAFILIFFRKDLYFGRCDWGLMTWTFGAPAVAAATCWATGVLGTNGAFCYFDGVVGTLANAIFNFGLLILIFVCNVTLYVLTWWRVRKEEPTFKNQGNNEAKVIRASHRIAKNMSLFVGAFCVQWWALVMYGMWTLTSDNVPQELFQLVVIFVNTGGILNGIVYILIRRRKSSQQLVSDTTYSSSERKLHKFLQDINIKRMPMMSKNHKVTENTNDRKKREETMGKFEEGSSQSITTSRSTGKHDGTFSEELLSSASYQNVHPELKVLNSPSHRGPQKEEQTENSSKNIKIVANTPSHQSQQLAEGEESADHPRQQREEKTESTNNPRDYSIRSRTVELNDHPASEGVKTPNKFRTGVVSKEGHRNKLTSEEDISNFGGIYCG